MIHPQTEHLTKQAQSRSTGTDRHSDFLYEPLTRRQVEVLTLIIEGMTNPQIARTLMISCKTVENHVHEILSKLNVSTRTSAATKALYLGIVKKIDGITHVDSRLGT